MTDDIRIKNRFRELANRSFQENRYTYTGFLNQSELEEFFEIERELSFVPIKIFQNIVRFGGPETTGYTEDFPVKIIKAEPLIYKFADDLTHRDFLGALMSLGIERDVIGEILVKDKTGYVFCSEKIAAYIYENLTKIRHTQIKTTILNGLPEEIHPEMETFILTVSSLRLDVIIGKAYNLSRSQSLELFRTKKIFLNSKTKENPDIIVKENDIVSVRGYGKFIFKEVKGLNKKGKFNIVIEKYI